MKRTGILVLVLLIHLSSHAFETPSVVRVRILTHARMMGFKPQENQYLKSILRETDNPVILYLMERRLLEGAFKRKAPAIIVKNLEKMVKISSWSLTVLPECFRWNREPHLQIALTYMLGAFNSGMNREIFHVLCSHFKSNPLTDVREVVSLIKMATLFSLKGLSANEALKVLRTLSLKRFSAFHFTLVSELTLLGVKAGMSPSEAISRARDLFTLPEGEAAGFRR